MIDFYKSEKISDAMTAIRSRTGEILYLIEGEKEALLVDTCLGVGHLKHFVDSLTSKPVTVVLTHGHLDHALGAPEFETVYMNPKDTELYERMMPLNVREGYLHALLGEKCPVFTEEDYVLPKSMKFLELKDNDSFDLGGLHVDIYALPGHTKGSMVLLVREEKALILGDACNKSTFLFDEDSLTVEEYRDVLTELEKRLLGTYKKVFLCHHDLEASVDIMKNVIEVCDDVLAGKADDIPFEFMGNINYIAKEVGERFVRTDGEEGNIIYNKMRIKK